VTAWEAEFIGRGNVFPSCGRQSSTDSACVAPKLG
jgi:hypothetical protein